MSCTLNIPKMEPTFGKFCINDLCDDTILLIFANFDLRTRRLAGETCRRWAGLVRKSWKSLQKVTLYQLFETPKLPKGKHLNKALHWVLKRCGKNLKCLNLTDLEPEFRFVKANERTFKIIGRYCHVLEEINFTCMLLLNDHLHEWVDNINCSKLKRVNLNCSFNHFCPVHCGLSALYSACPQIEYLNISTSLNARVRECEELWPTTLKEVYVNHAWALTCYSLCSLVKCCPDLRLFSMCGNQSGMDGGIKFILSRVHNLQILRLDEYPGDVQLGVQIGQLHNLRELYLSGSTMVTDQVITAVAEGCKKLEIVDLSVAKGHPECSRHGMLTDEGLMALANHLPSIKHLNLERRSCISDEGVAAILSNGQVEILSLAESPLITDVTLEALAAYCGDRIYDIRLTQLTSISSLAILNLCKIWFDKCTPKSGYRLEVHLDEMALEMGDFLQLFQPVTENSVHEFAMDADGERPRRTICLFCDIMLMMYL